MENLEFLDFKVPQNKVQDITIEQLRDTHIEYDYMGRPMKQIRHCELFDNIINEVKTAGYNPQVMDLFIANSGDRTTPGISFYPEVGERYGQLACKAYVVRRAFLNLNLTDFDTNEFTTNLAVSYHQGGIQVGFGQNVKICHNQCMLNADQYVATYGDKKYSKGLPIEKVMEVIRQWLVNAREKVQSERDCIKRMQEMEVPMPVFTYLIGELQILRVRVDSRNPKIKEKGKYYPLSQTQINTFTDRCLDFYHDHNRVTVWDLYNCATYEYSDHSMDIPKILPQNIEMVEFLDKYFHFRTPGEPSTLPFAQVQELHQRELVYTPFEEVS
jgi:hypothetical protein